MKQEIKTISLFPPFKIGSVNYYLIGNETGFILIYTGSSNRRSNLEKELEIEEL